MSKSVYKRVLLKLSGESLAEKDGGFGIDVEAIKNLAKEVLDGKNLVIKGPPGTGKSQTITNIISSLLSQGKKVLFVAQKHAALDVVRNNLKKNGLQAYILEVFSAKANKQQVFEIFFLPHSW